MQKRLRHSLLLVAELKGSIVGFANFSPVDESGKSELGAIYLYPEQQAMGIGTALLQTGIHSLEGVKRIYVEVEKENTIGQQFYNAKGFQVVDEFEDTFDGHKLKTMRMQLVL